MHSVYLATERLFKRIRQAIQRNEAHWIHDYDQVWKTVDEPTKVTFKRAHASYFLRHRNHYRKIKVEKSNIVRQHHYHRHPSNHPKRHRSHRHHLPHDRPGLNIIYIYMPSKPGFGWLGDAIRNSWDETAGWIRLVTPSDKPAET